MSEDPVKAQQSETRQDRYGNRDKQNKDTQKIRGKDRQHQQWMNEEKTSRRLKHQSSTLFDLHFTYKLNE